MSRHLLVYCAGAYSASDVITALGNVRRGLNMSYNVLMNGHYPYVPWNDLLLHLMGSLSIDMCYDWSMAFLKKCDCVLVHPTRAKESIGTQREIAVAMQLGIPVFYRLYDLELYAQGLTEETNDDA